MAPPTVRSMRPADRCSMICGRGATRSLRITLPGDYNADGIVDAADYTVWRDNLGRDSASER